MGVNNMMQVITIAFLLTFIIIREIIHWKEVNVLTDKILAKDYQEYKTMDIEKEKIITKRKTKEPNPQKVVRI